VDGELLPEGRDESLSSPLHPHATTAVIAAITPTHTCLLSIASLRHGASRDNA